MPGSTYAILDAARDYTRIGFARLLAPRFDSLFAGAKGREFDTVAPHLFTCDSQGLIAEMVLRGAPGSFGLVLETDVAFDELRKHLRRFLTVVREVDRKQVLFRYYDPRVLRVFLPVCNASELQQIFGPITAISCEADQPEQVVTYQLERNMLRSQTQPVIRFLKTTFAWTEPVVPLQAAGPAKSAGRAPLADRG